MADEQISDDKDSPEYKSEVAISLSANQHKLLRRLVKAVSNNTVAQKLLGLTDINKNLWRALQRKLGVEG